MKCKLNKVKSAIVHRGDKNRDMDVWGISLLWLFLGLIFPYKRLRRTWACCSTGTENLMLNIDCVFCEPLKHRHISKSRGLQPSTPEELFYQPLSANLFKYTYIMYNLYIMSLFKLFNYFSHILFSCVGPWHQIPMWIPGRWKPTWPSDSDSNTGLTVTTAGTITKRLKSCMWVRSHRLQTSAQAPNFIHY